MSKCLRIALFVILLSTYYLFGQEFEVPNTTAMRWFKGNTHTSEIRAVDSSPEDVIHWYKSHGYNFVVYSQERFLVDLTPFSSLIDSEFLLIPGEGLVTYIGPPKFVSVTAMNLRREIRSQIDKTPSAIIQKNVDAAREARAVPIIEHPNFLWSIDKEMLLKVSNYNLIEIFNGAPNVNNEGGKGKPGMEEVWDFLLTSGKRVYGIAADDAIWFKREPSQPGTPGRGWVVVLASILDVDEITQNLDSGLFYASTGVELEELKIEPKRIAIGIKQERGLKYWIDFIGTGGRVIHRTESNPAVYDLVPGEIYVRAKITDSSGHNAWIQPVFVRR